MLKDETNTKYHIPLILKLGVLRDNKKFLFLLVGFGSITSLFLAYKAGLQSKAMIDPGIILPLPFAFCLRWISNETMTTFEKIFNLNLSAAKENTEDSYEFNKFKKLFPVEYIEIVQSKLLELMCNKNEIKLLAMGFFLFSSITLMNDFYLGWFGTMYGVYIYPWTVLNSILIIYIYWNFLCIPLMISLLWMMVSIVRGLNFVLNDMSLVFLNREPLHNTTKQFLDFDIFRIQLKPLSDLAYSISLYTVLFSIIYTLSWIYMIKQFPHSLPIYAFPTLGILVGVIGFIFPQYNLHKVLKSYKENCLEKYYIQMAENRKEYLELLISNEEYNVMLKQDEIYRKKLTFLNELIFEAKKIDTWPYGTPRILKLLSLGSIQIILTIVTLIRQL